VSAHTYALGRGKERKGNRKRGKETVWGKRPEIVRGRQGVCGVERSRRRERARARESVCEGDTARRTA